MEPVTHILTGACLGRAGLNRKTPLATLTLAISAEIADLDIVMTYWGPVAYFEQHRGFTHTFLGVPFMAALTLAVVGCIYWLRRWRGWRPWWPVRWGLLGGYAMLGAASHILLDFTNTYGVRPLAPFHRQWYGWDIVFIVEPLLWVILGLGLVLPRLARLIDEEIGKRAGPFPGRKAALWALVLMVAFWGFRHWQHARAVDALQSRLYRGAQPLRVMAGPYYVDPFTWQAVVETQDFYVVTEVKSWSERVDPRNRALYRYKPEETAITRAAKQTYTGWVYMEWARFPVTETEKLDHGYRVRFTDLRYVYPESNRRPLRASVELDDDLKPVAQYWGSREQKGTPFWAK